MNKGQIYLAYFIIGLLYVVFNLAVRKLHVKNESDEGWIITPFWLLLWPLSMLLASAGWMHDKLRHKQHEE